MDIVTTAKKIAERLLPFFFKSKSIAQISSDIGTAADNEVSLLWEKVKPWFIEEYSEEKTLGEEFENDDVKGLIKKRLKNLDSDTQNVITALLNKLEERQSTTINTATVTGNKNIIIQGVQGNNGGININTHKD